MIAWLAIAGFLFSGACAGLRLLAGSRRIPGLEQTPPEGSSTVEQPETDARALADRVAALDVALISLMGAIAVQAAATGETAYLTLLVVIAIVGFTATVAASQFIERGRGRT